MIVARWSIEARFGHKPIVIEHMQRWLRDIGAQIGWNEQNTRMLVGSIGAHESTVQSEVYLNSLAELHAAFERLAQLDAHKDWSQELEPYVVSGTPRWEIFRVVA